jgi:cell volume regulation protein A
MATTEPSATAIALLVTSALVLGSAIASRFAARIGVPIVLLFLALGMLAGNDGIGGIAFDNHGLAFRIGTVSLVLILFDGGLNTALAMVKKHAGPAVVLATVGVVATASLVGVAAHYAGFPWKEAFLLGSIVSSTDAAAVFSVLRSGGVQAKERVGATLELESGLNDPMAVILTVVLTAAIAEGSVPGAKVAGLVVLQLVIGTVVGVGIALLSKHLLVRSRVPAVGLYPLLTMALAFLAFALATIAFGSGFLAVYVAGVGVGNVRLPYRAPLFRVHDFLAWGAQLVMFVVLGLLATPSRLLDVAPQGLGIAAFLCFVARPVTVFACLLPFRYPVREIAYVAWGGLKGAVPIVLAVMPVLAGVGGATRIFDVVFFVVFVSALVQGSTMRWLAQKLRVASQAPPRQPATLEIISTRALSADVLTFEVDAASAVCGVTLAEIPFPAGSSAMLVIRGDDLVAARGDTELRARDQVFILCRAEERPFFQLLFGRTVE